ncbi:hypothetical protein EDEG_02431 [Edhazardia aedis USNM 41457]|uniref:Uncharacterized protein n=1 Tax=Edhazardia aedis (strain USNM 41457) TaxID=1003232 RepID=J8ZU44_EDHAE|nr:hypothetical protein EDEG_02431 [Edhazardia aedis USNM 41457]|eukprot:EJW03178.1 hypothetical protein EDEG_02431 [Edhazardia aedis USNM 41457]
MIKKNCEKIKKIINNIENINISRRNRRNKIIKKLSSNSNSRKINEYDNDIIFQYLTKHKKKQKLLSFLRKKHSFCFTQQNKLTIFLNHIILLLLVITIRLNIFRSYI